uniref:SBF1/SBF2 domain-containing protein n=3 Tax=Ditylum brightwellii TaxID=49249 RepID=A0A7S4SG28_9STRA|mmetsp:Transcript_6780/g.8942  ORF Transcript_6780/g.8942 Transcript_6780/m.8942 type:complete len:1144 (+) Transcript_6780:324-3755(+)
MFARRQLNRILGGGSDDSDDSQTENAVNLAPRGNEDSAFTPVTFQTRTKKTKTTSFRRANTTPLPAASNSPNNSPSSAKAMIRSSSDPPSIQRQPGDAIRLPTTEHRASINSNKKYRPRRHPCQNLAPFDACVEACDALAANGGSQRQQIRHSASSNFALEDCSVMVSPDGTLLFLPKHRNNDAANDQQQAINNATLFYPSEDIRSAIITGNDLNAGGDKTVNGFSAKGWASHAASTSIRQSECSLKSTAAFVEELVLSQKESAARTMNACDKLRGLIMTLECAARTAGGERQRADSPEHNALKSAAGSGKMRLGDVKNKLFSRSKKIGAIAMDEIMSGTTPTDFSPMANASAAAAPGRVGPLFYPDSTLHGALMAFEQYHTAMAENDAARWRKAASIISTSNGSPTANNNLDGPSTPGGVLPSIRNAASKTSTRADKREKALYDIQKQVHESEIQLAKCREQASARWNDLHKAEEEVQRIYDDKNWERSQERERRRKARENEKRALDAIGQLDSGTTPQEIWELVAGVADDMEGGSFAPTGLPMVMESGPRDKALDEKLSKADDDIPEELSTAAANRQQGQQRVDEIGSASSPPSPPSSPLPMVDRYEIELQLNLPELRTSALAADDAVEDAAGKLLNRLSILDTTQRSARIAAEGCLLSACNAQASCLRSLVELERASIEDRLNYVKGLESAINTIDVRADINNYIEADMKNTRDGMTRLGGDDDGGVASALAVLNSHSETIGGGGSFGTMGGSKSMPVLESWGNDSDSGSFSRDDVEMSIEKLLTPNPLLSDLNEDNQEQQGAADADNEEGKEDDTTKEDKKQKREEALQEIDETVATLTEAVGQKTTLSRGHRASTCYALNNQRSIRTKVPSSVQFDGLCRVFRALLNGCDRGEASDVANAKMCMMLAQTFYTDGKDEEGKEVVESDDLEEMGEKEKEGIDRESSARKEDDDRKQERMRRIYVKSRLIRHPLFYDEDFWDQALFQCVSESLTKSGVMMNFEKPDNRNDSNNGRTVTKRKIRWYDLGADERSLAASQVHAVVFAQLGALAHSMVEFGCGIERACAFVRRLSIRHQLPLSQRTMLLQHLLRGKTKVSPPGTAAINEDESSPEKEIAEKGEEVVPQREGGEVEWKESFENQC